MGDLIHSPVQAVMPLDAAPQPCRRCQGTGQVYYTRPRTGTAVLGGKRIPCPDCDGTGRVGDQPHVQKRTSTKPGRRDGH